MKTPEKAQRKKNRSSMIVGMPNEIKADNGSDTKSMNESIGFMSQSHSIIDNNEVDAELIN